MGDTLRNSDNGRDVIDVATNRRNLVFRIAPAIALGGAFAAAPSVARADGGQEDVGAAGDRAKLGLSNAELKEYEDLETAFGELGDLTDAEVQELAESQMATGGESDPAVARIPLPGPAALVSCALTAAWVFRGGVSENRVIMQVTEVVVGCVGIPATSWVLVRVARLVWRYRKKIAAALAAAGLTAAQLAPLRNAPYPG